MTMMVMIVIMMIFIVADSRNAIASSIYPMPDTQFTSPKCDVSNNPSVTLDNSFGILKMSNDPLGKSITFNFDLGVSLDQNTGGDGIYSCELCNTSPSLCSVGLTKEQIKFATDITSNFKAILVPEHMDFPSNPMELKAKFKLLTDENGHTTITVNLEDILAYNIDINDESLACGKTFKLIILVVLSIDIPVPKEFVIMIGNDFNTMPCDYDNPILDALDCLIIKNYRILDYKMDNCIAEDKYYGTRDLDKEQKRNVGSCVRPSVYWGKIVPSNFWSSNYYNNAMLCNESWKDILNRTTVEYKVDIERDDCSDIIIDIEKTSKSELWDILATETITAKLNEKMGAIRDINNTISRSIDTAVDILERSCYNTDDSHNGSSKSIIESDVIYLSTHYLEILGILIEFNYGKSSYIPLCGDYKEEIKTITTITICNKTKKLATKGFLPDDLQTIIDLHYGQENNHSSSSSIWPYNMTDELKNYYNDIITVFIVLTILITITIMSMLLLNEYCWGRGYCNKYCAICPIIYAEYGPCTPESWRYFHKCKIWWCCCCKLCNSEHI